MSDELQRTIGALVAKVDSLKERVTKLEGHVYKIAIGAITVVIVYILRQSGLIL